MATAGATGPQIAHDRIDRFRPLGAFGKPVYQSHVQLRAMLRAKRGERAANYFARPTYDPDVGELRWTAEVPGTARGWHEMSEAEQADKALELEVVHAELQSYVRELREQAGGDPGGAASFASLLEQALRVPKGGEFLYFVGDQPVIAFWGFEAQDGASVDPSALAPRFAAAAPAAAAPVMPASAPTVMPPVEAAAPRRRPWWWWLLALLLLLLLLALLLGWLRGCGPAAGLAGGVDAAPPPAAAASSASAIDAVPDPAASAVTGPGAGPGGAVPGGGPGAAGPGGLPSEPGASAPLPGASVPLPGASAVPDVPPPELPGSAPGDVPPVPDPAASAPPPIDPAASGPPPIDPAASAPALPEPAASSPVDRAASAPPPGASAAPPRPGASGLPPPLPPLGEDRSMKLPPGNDPKQLKFLEGDWRAGDGLMDKQTQQPVDMSFKFRGDGQGEVTVRRPDGSTCSGPVQGRLSGGRLAIEGNQAVPCSGGGSYGAPKIECEKDRGGQTQCYGVNADGSKYYMGMQRR